MTGCGGAALLSAAIVLWAMVTLPAEAWPTTATRSDAAAKMLLQTWVRYPSVLAQLSDMVALGKRIFFDPALSASGRMSCASCRSPAHAYDPSDV